MLTEFILNDILIRTAIEPGLPLLDFIRDYQHLKGTKIGCREGDCGACTVLTGELTASGIVYKSADSCLEPMINVHGKHVVTIEGFDIGTLNPVQQFLVEHNGTQCGFCTPGFVVALMSYLMNDGTKPIESVSGNICRCTGYKSIERAINDLSKVKASLSHDERLNDLIKKGFLPGYFSTISERLKNIEKIEMSFSNGIPVGGGTDLMVQNPEHIFRNKVIPLREKLSSEIIYSEGKLIFGASASIQELFESPVIKNYFPQLSQYRPLFASEQIRHMGTVAGNIVNASPIGDLTIILLSLDASLEIISKVGKSRMVPLKSFYQGYKKTVLKEGELIQNIVLNAPEVSPGFSFLKVCKRQYLDIASVNSAMGLVVRDGKVVYLDYAIGGVAAIPFYASETIDFLKGKVLDKRNILKALESLQQEISPISDIRGSAVYKRLLVRQQFLGHILNLLPESFDEKAIKDLMIKSAAVYEEY